MGSSCVWRELKEPPAAIPPVALPHAPREEAQLQAEPQLHCGPHAQSLLQAGVVWQPQAQPAPWQSRQVQLDSVRSFMVVLLTRWL